MPRKENAEAVKTDSLEMISRLLALHLVKDMEINDAVMRLSAIGFDDKSVAGMVGTTESAVRGFRFRRSKQAKRKKSR